jgi:hypothetical protein
MTDTATGPVADANDKAGSAASAADPALTDGEAVVVGRIERDVQELSGRFDTRDSLEIIAGLILAFAAVVAAWSAYQNVRWNGAQAAAMSQAATLRTAAAQATSIAASQLDLDHQMFVGWLGAEASGDTTAQAFADRMRPEFRAVFDTWLSGSVPGAIPAGSPIDTPAYDEMASSVVQVAHDANALADEAIARAARANQTGANFVLVTVITSMVLFVAGISTRFADQRVRRTLVALATLMLIGGTAFMLSLPQSFSV